MSDPPYQTLPTDGKARDLGYVYDDAKAGKVRRFVETYCLQSRPPYRNKPIRLLPWQTKYINALFGWVHEETGERRYKESGLWVPKKNGKSTLCSALSVYFLLEKPGSECYCLASDVRQARIVFEEAGYFSHAHKALRGRIRTRDGLNKLTDIKGESTFRVLPCSRRRGLAGFNANLLIYDELAEIPPNVQADAWTQLRYATATRSDSLQLVASTAQYDKSTLAYEQFVRACKVADGEDDDERFLPVVFARRESQDWNDEKTWEHCNPSMGVTFSRDEMRRAHQEATKTPRAEHSFRVLRLNDWDAGHAERWIGETDWRKCGKIQNVAKLKKLCESGEAEAVVGCDLSKTQDLSATVVLVRHGDEYHIVDPRFYIPSDLTQELHKRHGQDYRTHARRGHAILTPGNVVDEAGIRDQIVRDCKTWYTSRVAYDPHGMEAMRQQLESEGLECTSISTAWQVMGPASCELEKLVLAGRISHGNHPLLDWNLANCRTKDSPLGDWVRPVKPSRTSGMKIDGVVSVIHALALYMSQHETTSFCEF